MAPSGVGVRGLLRRPAFRAIWAAGGLTLAVIPVLLVILVWTATQAFPGVPTAARTHDVAYALSLLGLSATVPTLLAALVSGTFADRFPRRRLMQTVNAVEILGLFAALLLLADRPTAPVALPFGPTAPLYLVLLLPCWSAISASATLFRPALNAAMPRVVEPSALGSANGALYAFGLTAGIAGSLLAPLLLSVSGAAAALALPLGYLVVAQFFLGILDSPVDPEGPRTVRHFRHDLFEGYRYLAGRRGLLGITVTALAINCLAAISFVELGLYVTVVLGAGQPIYLGALYSGASVGAAVGTLAISKVRFEPRAGRYLAGLAVVQGATVVALSVLRSFPAALVDMFLYGLIPGMAATVFFALVQATVRNDMLGRVLAADEVGSYSLVPVGQYLGGLVTLLVGVSMTFLLGGLGIVLTGIAMALLPSVRALGFSPDAGAPPTATEDLVASEGAVVPVSPPEPAAEG